MSLELAGLLVTSGAVPPTVVDDALRRQVLAGGAFDTALFEAGAALSEGDCLRFLEKASGLPGIDGPQLMATDPSAAALLPGKLAERHCLLPLREDDQLHVAVPFPVSKAMLEEVGFLLGKQLRPWVALEVRLREAISRIYRIPLPPRYATLAAMLGLTPAAPLPAPPELVEPAAAPTEPASPKFTAQTVPEQDPFRLIAENDGLVAALEKALEEAEKDPKLAHRRAAPRDKVDVAGLAGRIAAAAGTEAAEPLEKLTFGKAKAALAAAEDRHAIMGVALRFALKTFDFVAAFAVVGGNAVGWTSLTQEGFAPEKVERVSLPLDAPSVLRTVLFTRGRYLGPIPTDPISQQLVTGMGRPQPTVAFVGPIEVRERPVAILYADVVGRAVSDRKVAELVAFAQLVGRRLERLILENKRRLVAASQAAQPKDAAPNGAPAPQVAAPASEGAFLVPPTPTAAELFARGPSRPRKLAARAGLALPSIEPMPAPGVSRLSSRGATEAPAVEDLFAAADDLVSTDLAERALALGVLSHAPDVAAAVLATRFPGPLLRARVQVTELPSPEELGPIPGALARMGAAAARVLGPLVDHRDADCRYYALLTAGRVPCPALVGPVAARVFDHQAVVASAARVALAAMRHVPGFADALERLRSGLAAREVETVVNAAKALGPLHDLPAIERLIELTGSDTKAMSQAAADALREITKQTLGLNYAKWCDWWESNRDRPRAAWLVEGLRHRDFDIRLSAIDELVRAVNDNFGYYADAPKAERDGAVQRWIVWYQHEGDRTPID